MVGECDAPDVESPYSARHVAHEVEPEPVGRDGRVGIARERVLRDFEPLRVAPGGIGALAGEYLGIARIVGVVGAACEVHRLAVGREGAGPLVVVRVQFRLDFLGLSPLAFVVLLRHEDVSGLGTRDAAYLVACGLWPCAGDEELVVVVAVEHGREVCPPAVQQGFLLDGVRCGSLLPLGGQLAASQSDGSQRVSGCRRQEGFVVLDGILVVAHLLLRLCQVENGCRVGVVVSDGVLVGSGRLSRVVHASVCLGHLPSPFAAFLFLLDCRAGIGLLVFGCRVIVFADGVEGIALLHVFLGAARGQHGDDRHRCRHPQGA